MRPLSASEVEKAIASATATDVTTGRTQDLVRKGQCHFFERFRAGAYEVQLRLDWRDIDESGWPRLDADFYDPATGLIDKSMKGHLAHHTDTAGDGGHSYVWEFEDERRHLRIVHSWYISGEGRMTLSGSGTFSAVDPSE